MRNGFDVEMKFTNHYIHCGAEWSDTWDSMCNDHCPVCDGEIEPYKSEELDANGKVIDEIDHVGDNWIPEGGWPK